MTRVTRMKRLKTLLHRQPWMFPAYALSFGGAAYLAHWLPYVGGSPVGVEPTLVGTVAYAAAMSMGLGIRRARRDTTLGG